MAERMNIPIILAMPWKPSIRFILCVTPATENHVKKIEIGAIFNNRSIFIN